MTRFSDISPGTKFIWVSEVKVTGECIKVESRVNFGLLAGVGLWVHLETGLIYRGGSPDDPAGEEIVLS